jgi:hypothetical protein
MILTGENRSRPFSKTNMSCLLFFNINPTWTGLGLKLGLGRESSEVHLYMWLVGTNQKMMEKI